MTDVSTSITSADAVAEGSAKVNLLGLPEAKLVAFFESIGEKKFRAIQVMKWIHQLGADNFEDMTNVSKDLRAKLKNIAEIRLPEVVQQFDSTDGTRKFLIRVSGGSVIETVFIPDGDRGTLCVSSQVGCSLDCSFCATGKQGFNRDLTAAEIIGQVWIAAKSFGQLQANGPRRVTNVVMMGMGEPLLNFDNVVDSMNLMMHDNAYGISKRRVTLSTSGVVPQLDRLSQYTDACLAISLHAPNDELRNELVPINRKYPIAMLLDSAKRYISAMPDTHRKITIEYTLIDQVNDRPHHAHQLAELLRDVPVKINLIPFNPFNLSNYKRVSNNALRKFQDILMEAGYITTVRTTRGDDIDAACGQLAGQVNDVTRRSERYRAQFDEIQAVKIVNQ
ncbi:23S rRNA (adenine(2503)-C(2))-methyltransferase RlmN [Cellvibrio sp. PSBB023]|jgi:23S rRNA (adenine2503-C2)-methyltransferase|uniref:23S rRNA (adenine(2503)-C(2))-methyltransferase RlmN n=1 Tax=Cellvibrio sp. PSBB023 TaxID=1945512 RepID=UPI00098ED25F|nr:23S rRNA (adenine(2503)-C(2))-methyltransferase RlmN [Cellvibrio sp. PSBB023]AQT59233.1 23S rRNA (adenine(2503)-C(2))-methyltransferase [Cellvibrio sp. PSBB023]